MHTVEVPVQVYTFPADAEVARASLVAHLSDQWETWLIVHGGAAEALEETLLAAHGNGVPLHLYMDVSQNPTRGRKVAQRLAKAGVEVTVGTGVTKGKLGIAHNEGMVVNSTAGMGPLCWVGPVDFWPTSTATALVFNDRLWGRHFLQQFSSLSHHAWEADPSLQVLDEQPHLAVAMA